MEARSCNSTHFLRTWWRRQPGQPSLKKRDAEVPKKLSGLAAVVLEKQLVRDGKGKAVADTKKPKAGYADRFAAESLSHKVSSCSH